MPITNIIKMYRKTKKLILVLIFSICITGFLYGYSQKSENDRLQHYLEQSQFYYQRALKLYKDLISRTKDASQLRLGLGRLYYSHGVSGGDKYT
jgi:cbb3-type cytochrome oxidase subunit 3